MPRRGPPVTWLRAVAVAAVGWIALRFALHGALELAILASGMAHRPYGLGEQVGIVFEAIVGVGVLGLVRFAWQRLALPRHEAALAGLAGLMPGLALVALHWQGLQDGFFQAGAFQSPERVPGRFPYPANSTVPYTRPGYFGHATIGPHGHRICAPPDDPATGDARVLLIGDSMMIGQGVPDELSLCWKLRETLAARAPGRFQPVNWGQSGAGAISYDDNLAFALAQGGGDVAVVGLLVPEDSQVFDLNSFSWMREAPWFRAASAVFGPWTVLSAAVVFPKRWRAEFYDVAAIEDGLRHLEAVAAAHELPLLVFVWDDPYRGHAETGMFTAFTRAVAASAERSPWVTDLGVLTEPPADGGEPYRIPGDGHLTPRGSVYAADWLATALQRHVPEAP